MNNGSLYTDAIMDAMTDLFTSDEEAKSDDFEMLDLRSKLIDLKNKYEGYYYDSYCKVIRKVDLYYMEIEGDKTIAVFFTLRRMYRCEKSSFYPGTLKVTLEDNDIEEKIKRNFGEKII